MTEKYEYKVGGSLGENAPSYVTRQADSDLYNSLKAGEFCYIFNSRQMGKTSLIVRTIKKLEAEGLKCTSLDFSVRGSRDNSSEQWYAGIVYKLVTNFNLDNPSDFLRNWWLERGAISPVQRLEDFIETVLLASIPSKIVIFIDEIDSILSLGFPTDDFFALIRSCYEKRNFNPEYRRLTFALVGVATPNDLIADKRRTPFNIGRAIQLDGFKESEMEPLAKGFEGYVENPLALMREVLTWTGGQPFLTQKVCKLLQEIPSPLSNIIKNKIIENWESHDEPEHLKTIQDRMLLEEQVAGRFLGWYQQILLSGNISVDDSLEQMRFRLTGLVVKQQDKLKVYNKIYASVFDLNWVEQELVKLRPYAENFQAWVSNKYQDKSRLLRGQALQEALKWSSGRSLSNEDSKYLTASQELEKTELEVALVLKEEESRIFVEESRILAQANDTLTIAQKKAKRRIRLGNIIFAVSLGGAIVASTLVSIANKQLQEAKIVTALEQSSARLLSLPKSSLDLENLIDSMQSGVKLKNLVKDSRHQENYPTISPLLALQTTLENIREKNELPGSIVRFSPDGKIMATASRDGTAKLLNLKGETITTLKHDNNITDVVFSQDGQIVATASDDNTAKLWNLKGGMIVTFKHQDSVEKVALSQDGQTVATVSSDNAVRLWNLKGEIIATLKHQGRVEDVVFSPDGQTVATASGDKTAKLWNLKGEVITSLKHEDQVVNVAFSPDGQTMATASLDKTAKLWNLKGEVIATLKHQSRVINVVFSPDGQTVATTFNKTAKLWNLKGEEIATLEHQGLVQNVVFSPDGQTVATASFDGTAKLWRLKGEVITTFKHQGLVENVVFSPDGQTVATTSVGGTVKLWRLKGEVISTLKHQDGFINVAFSPDGQTLAGISKDKTAKLLNLKGDVIATFKHLDGVVNLAFSPDGQTVATASDDKTAKLWNLKGEEIATLEHQDGVINVIFSPNGQTVATASYDGTAKLWNLKGKLIATLKHQTSVQNVVFSPDGKTVATASEDSTAKLWNLEGKLIATLKHEYPVRNVAFSLDGKIVATASDDKTAKLWNLEGKVIATLSHQDSVSNVVFSQDGKIVASVSNDNTVHLWNLEGKVIATLSHQDNVSNVVFNQDGKTVVTSSDDGTVRLWTLVGDTWRQLAEYQGKYGRFSPDGKLVAINIDNNTVELRRFEGLDDLLARGCNWMHDYLATRNELRSKLCTL